MKFVQFVYNDYPDDIRLGCLEGEDVVDLNKYDSSIPTTMLECLKTCCMCKIVDVKNSKPPVEPKSNVTLVAPVTGMDKILCLGQNYSDMCKQLNIDHPKVVTVFSKFASCIIGPNEPLRLRTEVSKKVDWEVEFVVVIGVKCSDVKAADAFKYVCGYTIAQDISSRDWQKNNGGQFLLGKVQDTFCPIGPCIVTKDEISDPSNLSIKCSINGVEKQNSNTSQLIHKIDDVIERLSSIMTLLPGDILLTGTPAGVGSFREPPEFLKPGDIILSEIEKIGSFETKVVKF